MIKLTWFAPFMAVLALSLAACGDQTNAKAESSGKASAAPAASAKTSAGAAATSKASAEPKKDESGW